MRAEEDLHVAKEDREPAALSGPRYTHRLATTHAVTTVQALVAGA